MYPRDRRLRSVGRFVLPAALLLAAGCSAADPTLSPGQFQLTLNVPASMVGAWSSPVTGVLLCRPTLVVTAAGPGHAVWTGATTRLTAPYGTYDGTLTLPELVTLLGAEGIDGGQTVTAPIPKAGYASYRFRLTVDYRVEGTGKTGSASAAFACEAP